MITSLSCSILTGLPIDFVESAIRWLLEMPQLFGRYPRMLVL